MKRMCLGTIITLLYQSKIKSTYKIKHICDGVFMAYGLSLENRDVGIPSHLKSGHDNVPDDLQDAARQLSIEDISTGIQNHVIGLIHNDKHQALFRAIKDILREDTSITDSTIVGRVQGYEKNRILNCDTFNESMLLANIITYAITSVDNKSCAVNIREIDKNYLDGFVSNGEDIFFESPNQDQTYVSPIKKTIKDPSFNRIFNVASEITINGMNNPTKASVYYVDPQNCKFRFRELEEYIINNVGSYVFSRAKAQRISNLAQDPSAVGSHAIIKFIQSYGANAENVLGELLLYVFLEQALGAPKIMSRIEFDSQNQGIVSKSDGVHLLTLDNSGQLFHQLVFGASNIVGDLKVAVDRAFDKIISIESNSGSELRMVENAIQSNIFDTDETQYLVEMMRPRRGGSSRPDMAFGAFLGYTITLNTPEPDSQKYKTAVKNQLIADIDSIQSYIRDLIIKNNLSGYSFYFYVLPFNDAPNEKTSIIDDLLSGGVI